MDVPQAKTTTDPLDPFREEAGQTSVAGETTGNTKLPPQTAGRRPPP